MQRPDGYVHKHKHKHVHTLPEMRVAGLHTIFIHGWCAPLGMPLRSTSEGPPAASGGGAHRTSGSTPSGSSSRGGGGAGDALVEAGCEGMRGAAKGRFWPQGTKNLRASRRLRSSCAGR